MSYLTGAAYEDVETYRPGLLKAYRDWFTVRKSLYLFKHIPDVDQSQVLQGRPWRRPDRNC